MWSQKNCAEGLLNHPDKYEIQINKKLWNLAELWNRILKRFKNLVTEAVVL